MANEFDELEQDGLFDLDDFVEKSARNEYVLLVGSEVMLEPEAPYTKRLISDVPKIHEPWDLSTVDLLHK